MVGSHYPLSVVVHPDTARHDQRHRHRPGSVFDFCADGVSAAAVAAAVPLAAAAAGVPGATAAVEAAGGGPSSEKQTESSGTFDPALVHQQHRSPLLTSLRAVAVENSVL